MPYLSHSQCEMVSQCMRRYFLTKIEGAPQAPSESLILGSSIHTALEADGLDLMTGYSPLPIEALWSHFLNALGNHMADDDPSGLLAQQLPEIREKGRAILRAYVEHLQLRYAPQAVEESFTVEIPGAPGWKFTGRIDARVTLADGTPAILDFKTGKAWQPGAEDGKDQATAYIWATNQQGSEAEGDRQNAVVFAIFPTFADDSGGYTCKPQFRITSRTEQQLRNYLAYLVATTQQITEAKRSGDFPARTGPLCAYCGVLGSCPQGQRWLADHNRKPAIPMVRRQPQGPLDEHEEVQA